MAVQTTWENLERDLRAPRPSHPLAEPVAPGAESLWLVRKPNAAPLGFVLHTSDIMTGHGQYDAYAHCRDDANKRPWLKTFQTLNSAVAWMIQHERDIRGLIQRSLPETEAWPPS